MVTEITFHNMWYDSDEKSKEGQIAWAEILHMSSKRWGLSFFDSELILHALRLRIYY